MPAKQKQNIRADREGTNRTQFEKNKRRVLLTQDICGICGKPVDKSLKWPHPLSATVDHIIPIDKGGHPSSIDNLQLAHMTCNRQKSDKIIDSVAEAAVQDKKIMGNRVLPHSCDWLKYRSKDSISYTEEIKNKVD